MPRENVTRQERNAQVKVTDIATETRKVFARDIGQTQSSRSGLESLGSAFSQFFGGLAQTTREMAEVEIKQQNIDIKRRAEATEKYAQAYDKIEAHEAAKLKKPYVSKTVEGDIEYQQTLSQERISDSETAEREAAAQQEKAIVAQAQADAAAGVTPATQYQKNAAYMTAYTMGMGERDGERAAVKWEEHLRTLGADANIDEEFAKFSHAEFGAGVEGEFGAFYNAKAVETLSKRGQSANRTWRENRAKTMYNQGLVNLGDSITRQVATGTMTVGGFIDATQASIALHKDEPQKARPFVAGAILEAAVTPEALANAETILKEPGTGLNGKSFAESFPGEWGTLQDKMQARYKGLVSIRAAAEYARADEIYRAAELAGTDEALLDAHAVLMDVYDRVGGPAEYEKRVGRFTSRLQKIGEQVRDQNLLHEITEGRRAADPKLIESTQEEYFKRRGVTDILADRETSAVVATWSRQQGGLASKFENQISLALGDSTNPERQAAAFYLTRALQKDGGPMPKLSAESKVIYSMAATAADVSNDDPTMLFGQLAAMTPADRKAASEPVKWQSVYNQPDVKATEARRMAERDLAAGVAKELNLDPDMITMDPGVADALTDAMGMAVTRARAAGVNDPVAHGVRFATKDAGVKFIPVPAGNGRTRLAFNTLPARDSMGHQIVAPGISTNPINGVTENTLETFREDMARLAARLPDMTALQSDDVSLSLEKGRGLEEGVFRLTNGGAPIVFAPGQQLTAKDKVEQVSDADITLPKDPKLASQMLDAWLPAGFKSTVVNLPQGPVLLVGYRFRYQDMTTLGDKARGWKQPGPKPRGEDMFPFPY